MISLTIFFFIFFSFQVQTSPDKFIQNGHFPSSFQKWPLICNMAVTMKQMLGLALLKKSGHFGFAGNVDKWSFKIQMPQNSKMPVIRKRLPEVHGLKSIF